MLMDVNKINTFRLKIKYPDGSEIEIEGTKEFIDEEKTKLLEILGKKEPDITEKTFKDTILNIIDFKSDIAYIKTRNPDLDIQSASLILILSYCTIQDIEKVSAIKLSKSLKISGYSPKRLDRILISMIKEKTIISYGTKRNREYSLTEKGRTKAIIKLKNLSKLTKLNNQF